MRRRWKRRFLWAALLAGLALLAIPATVADLVRSLTPFERRAPMRKLIAVAVLVVLAVVVGSSTLATASPTAAERAMTLVAVDVPKSEISIDVGKKGDSEGDAVLFAETLLRDGKKVGRTDIHCVFARVVSRCGATLSLPGGTLEAVGGIRFAKTFSVPVVGGTGAYAGARGVVRITELSETRSRYVVELAE